VCTSVDGRRLSNVDYILVERLINVERDIWCRWLRRLTSNVKTCPKHALNTLSSDFHRPIPLPGSCSNSWLWRNVSTSWKLLSRETQTKLTLSKHLKNVVLHLGIKIQPICHSLPPGPWLPIQLGVRLSLKVYLLSWPSEFWSVSSRHWACWPISSIVFVHGLLGHRTETWTKDGVCWPRDLLSTEETLSHIRVLTFGYNANVVNLNGPASLNSVLEHSISLLSELARERRKAAVSDLIFSVAIHIQIYLAGPALDFCCSLSRWTDNQRCMSFELYSFVRPSPQLVVPNRHLIILTDIRILNLCLPQSFQLLKV